MEKPHLIRIFIPYKFLIMLLSYKKNGPVDSSLGSFIQMMESGQTWSHNGLALSENMIYAT